MNTHMTGKDYSDRQNLLVYEALKRMLNRHRDKVVDEHIRRGRELREIKRVNKREFFRHLGECEKE